MATLTAYPFDGVPTTEDQYAALMGLFEAPGVEDMPGGNALKVSADGSGMVVQVADGAAFHSGFRAVLSGGPAAVPVQPAGSTTRTDRVVLRWDTTANEAVLVCLTPDDPAEDFDLHLADVTVAAGAVVIAGSAVTDRRQFIGFMVRAWSQRPTGRNALGYNTARGVWEYTVDGGTTWKDLTLQVIVANSIPEQVTANALLLIRQPS